uniref:Si:dkey-199f5.8 n=1 Tax=Oryzias sinensis TaxID=183150 RepID=A0A8C7YCE2_9TELE
MHSLMFACGKTPAASSAGSCWTRRKMLEPRMMTLSPPFLPPQAGNYTFNRAKLMNIGFREAMREEDWDCLFFHDVDLIPEDDRNTYICDANPKHAAIAMDKFGYKLPYNMYFGGVSALSPLQYLKMNGFPNNYWGWGGEDDDIGIRVSLAGMHISRPPLKHGRYKMIKHKLDQGNDVNPKRFNMLAKTRQTWKLDGMNSLEYEVVSREYLPLYANITVDIGTEKGLKPKKTDGASPWQPVLIRVDKSHPHLIQESRK